MGDYDYNVNHRVGANLVGLAIIVTVLGLSLGFKESWVPITIITFFTVGRIIMLVSRNQKEHDRVRRGR